MVVTDLGVLRPDPESNELVMTDLHPDVTTEQVRAATGWDLRIAERMERTRPPSAEELGVLCRLEY